MRCAQWDRAWLLSAPTVYAVPQSFAEREPSCVIARYGTRADLPIRRS